MPGGSTYPATFTFDPLERVENWRSVVNWILAIPHFFVLYVLGAVSGIVSFVSWFYILFTGTVPDTFTNLQAMYLRYEIRTYTYALFMREDYPPFAFGMTAADGGEDPRVRVEFTPQLIDRNRLTVAFRIILIIPHAIVLWLLGVASTLVTLVAVFVVLFTGKWPDSLRTFVLNVTGWSLRVSAYWLLLTDEYPPFSLT